MARRKPWGGLAAAGTRARCVFFENQQHIPAFFAFLAITAEFLGGIGLILGLLGRVAAFGITCNMLVAIATVHTGTVFTA